MIKELTLIPFEPAHAFVMTRRPEEVGTPGFPGYEDYIKGLCSAGNCYSATYGDEILFCGGVRVLWPGVGEAWVLCSAGIWRFARQLFRVSETIIGKVAAENNLERVQAHVRTSWDVAIRFVERLGFEREGLLRKFVNGEDYYSYARVR
jgi:hypothetical protein